MDKRKLLRASPPEEFRGKTVTVHLSNSDYEKLYYIAFEKNLSLAETIRLLIRKG